LRIDNPCPRAGKESIYRSNEKSKKLWIIEKDKIKFLEKLLGLLKGEKKPLEETKIKPDIFYKKDDIIDFAKSYLKKL